MKSFSFIAILGMIAMGCGGAPKETPVNPAQEETVEQAQTDETASEEETGAAEGNLLSKCSCKHCNEIAEGTGWCDDCNVGVIDGKVVECKGCVEAALNDTTCPHCQAKQE